MFDGTKPIKIFCQKIDKKTPFSKMNCRMFLRRCSYKNSCFSELTYNSPVSLCYSADLQLEIQKRDYLKNVALHCAFGFDALFPIQVVVSLPLWIKLTMGQFLLFFLCNFSSFFSYVRGIPVTNHLTLFVDWYSSVAMFWLFSKL